MNPDYDYLVVGAGISGAIVAERLASQKNKRVLVVEKSSYPGGLCHDFTDDSGVLVHSSGLHVFHTNSVELFKYLNQFSDWTQINTRVGTYIGGKTYPYPFTRAALSELLGQSLKSEADVLAYIEKNRVPIAAPKNAEEMALSLVGERLYSLFFEGYTRKWWGLDPKEVDARITSRISIRTDDSLDYQKDSFQGVPSKGFHTLFSNILSHPLITVAYNTDFSKIKDTVKFGHLVYTGSLDSFFDFELGVLPYRSMRFEYETHDVDFYQQYHQVMYPNDFEFMRIFEFKHATAQKHPKTTIIKEFPVDCTAGMRRDYPIPRSVNFDLFNKYKAKAAALKNISFLGRLADYKYYTIGQAAARALTFAKNLGATHS